MVKAPSLYLGYREFDSHRAYQRLRNMKKVPILDRDDMLTIYYRTKEDPTPRFSKGDIVEHILIPGHRFRIYGVSTSSVHEKAVLMSHEDAEEVKRKHLESLGVKENKAIFDSSFRGTHGLIPAKSIVELCDCTIENLRYEACGYDSSLRPCSVTFDEQDLVRVDV